MTTECVLTARGATSTIQIFADSNAVTNFTIPAEGTVFPTVNIPTIAGNVATFSGTEGVLTDSGTPLSNLQLKSNILCDTVENAGLTDLIVLTVPGVTSNSVALATLSQYSYPTYIQSVYCSESQIHIQFQAAPGICFISYLVFKNT